MKTIFDAVNYYKGSKFITGKHEEHHTHLASCQSGGGIYSVYACDAPSSLIVCSIGEFNALVEEMKLGLDVNKITEGVFRAYICNPKELLEPEPTKQASNTYTQEMADNGVLPSAGMECLVSNRKVDSSTFEKATILFIGKFVVLYNSESCAERVGDMDSTGYITFKPLTPPVPLIDGKAYQFDLVDDTVCGIFRSMNNRFYNVDGDVCTKNCTNIQPLTLVGE